MEYVLNAGIALFTLLAAVILLRIGLRKLFPPETK